MVREHEEKVLFLLTQMSEKKDAMALQKAGSEKRTASKDLGDTENCISHG